jgi:hypothetical protein
MTYAVSIAQRGSNNTTFRNRIINGAMMIDQRNAGASITVASGSDSYPVDRMFCYVEAGSSGTFTAQQSTTVPAGFKNSVVLTTATADSSIGAAEGYSFQHRVEGLNVADLGWGTANAQSVTLSFWVRSSLTGTFAGSVTNGSFNRAYVFNYTISAANTWEYKTVTIAGDTSGTWLTTNGIGLIVYLSIGAGSNYNQTAGSWGSFGYSTAGAVNVIATSGATFYITGVQLEAGTAASPFENRLYGTELSLCQRYYVDLANNGGSVQNLYRAIGFGSTYSTTQGSYVVQVPVPMRVVPSLTQTGTMYLQNLGATSISSFAGPYSMAGTIVEGDFTMVGAVAANAPGILRWNNSATQKFAYSAEL